MLQYSLIIRYCFSISSLIISFSFYSSIGLTSFNSDSRAPSYHVNNLSPSDIKGPREWHPNIFVYKSRSHMLVCLCQRTRVSPVVHLHLEHNLVLSQDVWILHLYYNAHILQLLSLLIFNISVLTPLFKESYMRVSLNSTWSVNSRPTHK